jgi:hypothetical protein
LPGALILPVRSYNLHVRQNDTRFNGAELQQSFDAGLPTA